MRILCDVDGILADFTGRYLGCLYAATKKWYQKSQVTQWDFISTLGITKEEDQAALALVAKNLDFAPLPGSIEAVRGLIAAGHEVVFVTSDHGAIPTWGWERDRWLAERFPGVPVIHTNRKDLIHGDCLIDDRDKNVLEWLAANPNGIGFLWDAPYNQGAQADGLVRCHTWEYLTARLRVLDDYFDTESTRVAERRAP